MAGLPAGRHRIEAWLPHNETFELIELRADAPIEPDDTRLPLWLHHGSSISSRAEPSGTSHWDA